VKRTRTEHFYRGQKMRGCVMDHPVWAKILPKPVTCGKIFRKISDFLQLRNRLSLLQLKKMKIKISKWFHLLTLPRTRKLFFLDKKLILI
jgi:hypothetical protein